MVERSLSHARGSRIDPCILHYFDFRLVTCGSESFSARIRKLCFAYCFAYFVFDISEKSCGFAFMKIVVVFITVSAVIHVSLLKEVGNLELSLWFQTVGALGMWD